jgi:hypothetical protein
MQRRQLKPMLLARMLHAGKGGDLRKKPHRPAPAKHTGSLHHPLDINVQCFELQRNTADRVAVVNRHDEASSWRPIMRVLFSFPRLHPTRIPCRRGGRARHCPIFRRSSHRPVGDQLDDLP